MLLTTSVCDVEIAPQHSSSQCHQGALTHAIRMQRMFELEQSGSLAELVPLNLTVGLISKFAFMVFTGRLWLW